MLLLDGTFLTNALNLVLIIAYSVINTDKTFPLCLSFARSKSKMSFDFILSSMKLLIFVGQPSALQDGETTGKISEPIKIYHCHGSLSLTK
jgi:MULE transposase domain